MRPPTRFVVVTTGRSGSNLLLSLLESHPSIRHCSEIVGNWMLRREPVRAKILKMGTVPYAKICLDRREFESVVGLKVLYHQLSQKYADGWGVPDIPELLDYLVSDKDIKVIHLKRRNLFKTLVSIRVAKETQQHVLFDEDNRREVQIEIPIDKCVEHFEQTRQWEREFEAYFQEHHYLEMLYEDLTAQTDGECDRVLDFLGVPHGKLETNMLKQRTRSLADTVTNYGALKEYFSDTEWEKFFTD